MRQPAENFTARGATVAARQARGNVMFKSTLRTPGTATSAPVVALRDVRKVYGRGEGAVAALDGVSVALAAGSFTALMGRSGSGKSTFLNVAAGLDRPTSARSGWAIPSWRG
jgi:ABC-type glutathione transport system ATPase component